MLVLWNVLRVTETDKNTTRLQKVSTCLVTLFIFQVEHLWGSYLFVELLVHQQVRLGPASEEPHDVLAHLRAQQLRQTRSRRPGLDLRRPQHRRQQPGTERALTVTWSDVLSMQIAHMQTLTTPVEQKLTKTT